jgi:phenylalanyl-tRNA synthetase beta subunit
MLFQEILPNEVFDFKIVSRELLDTKINNEIVALEVDINRFSNDILSYKEVSQPPESFVQYSSISDLPSSIKDISYSIKDYSKTQELQDLLLNYQSDIIKNIYIFDYFINEKQEEIKIGFRVTFQSKKVTLNSAEIELVYNDIVNKSLNISGISIPGL